MPAACEGNQADSGGPHALRDVHARASVQPSAFVVQSSRCGNGCSRRSPPLSSVEGARRMIPISDDNPTLRTPLMTYAILATLGAVWVFVQGMGAELPMVSSICNL